MMVWEWTTLMVFVQVAVSVLFFRRIGKGRLLSRPLWRFRPFRPVVSYFTGEVYGVSTRVAQIVVVTVPHVTLSFVLAHRYVLIGQLTFAVIIIALYLDDYLTGDDDRWKRFKEWVKNKIKWKMHLPATVPSR